MQKKQIIQKPAMTQVDANKIIVTELIKMHRELKRYNSMKATFLRGIVSGFGYVIGATVVVSIVLFILAQLSHVGVLKPFIEGFLAFIGK